MAEDSRKEPVNVAEYESLAKKILPKTEFDHIAGGADEEHTLRDNIAAFRRIRLLPRVLRDVTRRNLSTTVLGQSIAFPAILGPVACLRRFHPDGELAVARAAGSAGTLCTAATGACYSVEQIAAAATGPLWFQLYVYNDKTITRGMVDRAEKAGCKAICLTVDAPVIGRRDRDLRNKYHFPRGWHFQILRNLGFKDLSPDLSSEQLLAFAAKALTVALTWDYLGWLRSITRLPLVLKGILSREDALQAVAHGADGIVVSNHGGRQLDGAPASIDVLSSLAEAVDGRAEILLDSGVRRGTDILKALALGARAVLVGRPYVWGLAVAGESGVRRVLDILREEFDIAMALTGCSKVSEIDKELIVRP